MKNELSQKKYISWGTKITILYLGFVALIVTLVVLSFNKKVDLVSQQYYHDELHYEDRLIAMRNAQSLEGSLQVEQQGNNFTIELPAFFSGRSVKGTVHFFRPSDSSLDKIFSLSAEKNLRQKFSSTGLAKGKYIVKTAFSCEGKNYYFETDVNI